MAVWYQIRTVPLGTCAWLAEQDRFLATQHVYSEGLRKLRALQEAGRSSGWVGDYRATMELYKALIGKVGESVDYHIWHETGEPDPYRLALVGGDLKIAVYAAENERYPEWPYRCSTAEEAAQAAATMETIGERLHSREEALQPFARDIEAYLSFYRSLRLGEEELIYGKTG